MLLREHQQVLHTLEENGRITKLQMKTIKKQLMAMKEDEEREIFLKKIIFATRNNNIRKGKYEKPEKYSKKK